MSDEDNRVAEHYEGLLAGRYTWMVGDLETKVDADARLFAELGLPTRGRAIDLGCGPGYQSFALARSGLSVTAVDLSDVLLNALTDARGDLPITVKRADLVDALRTEETGSSDVVVCMGDTLPHLPDRDTVRALFTEAARVLTGDGRLLLTWREMANPPRGVDRFIPVRSDDDRLMICFLDTHDDHIEVTDLFHERGPDGWTLRRGSYRKLRLAAEWVSTALTDAGFTIDTSRPGPLTTLVARAAVA